MDTRAQSCAQRTCAILGGYCGIRGIAGEAPRKSVATKSKELREDSMQRAR